MQREVSFRRAMLVGRQRLFTDAVQVLLTQCGVLSVTVVADAALALAVASSARPQVVLVDVDDETEARLRAGREIADADPATVVVSVSADPAAIGDGDELHGHLSKHVGVDAFVSALDAAVGGERIVQRAPLGARARGPEAPISLTVREREVLELLAGAATSREIAARLGISLNTERTHVRSLLWKLQAHSREEAVAKAAHAGLVVPTAGRGVRVSDRKVG